MLLVVHGGGRVTAVRCQGEVAFPLTSCHVDLESPFYDTLAVASLWVMGVNRYVIPLFYSVVVWEFTENL